MPRDKDPKAEALAFVKRDYEQVWQAKQRFSHSVQLASERGLSIREIAEAAGVKSHNTIWRILNPTK